MQSVIGTYESFEQAGAAVRSLERHLSIQDIVVADRSYGSWRKFGHLGTQEGHAEPRFLVVMTGAAGAVEQARELLALFPSPPPDANALRAS
jgi:hypothetical protein